MTCAMSYEAFEIALLEAGWRPHCDAQHTGARALYARLYGKPAALLEQIEVGAAPTEPITLRLPPFDGVEDAQLALGVQA